MVDTRTHWRSDIRPSAPVDRRPHPAFTLEAQCRTAMHQMRYEITRVDHMMTVRGHRSRGGLSALLPELLESLARSIGCEVSDLRLDHNPALSLREYDSVTHKFTPDANDYYFLTYRSAADHHIKTNVAGDGAQRSDTAERMHRRRLDENRGLRWRKPKKQIKSAGFRKPSPGFKYKWPKRSFPPRPSDRQI